MFALFVYKDFTKFEGVTAPLKSIHCEYKAMKDTITEENMDDIHYVTNGELRNDKWAIQEEITPLCHR